MWEDQGANRPALFSLLRGFGRAGRFDLARTATVATARVMLDFAGAQLAPERFDLGLREFALALGALHAAPSVRRYSRMMRS